jgi:hypothetical protein
MRLVRPDDLFCERKGRVFTVIMSLGGATGSPSWAKAWLSILGVYEWEGMNAIPPELWLLPKSFPLHPWRWWTHTRAVYIPMGYLYGKKFKVPLNDLTRSIREVRIPQITLFKIALIQNIRVGNLHRAILKHTLAIMSEQVRQSGSILPTLQVIRRYVSRRGCMGPIYLPFIRSESRHQTRISIAVHGGRQYKLSDDWTCLQVHEHALQVSATVYSSLAFFC